jgi:tripartite-type tricarboxylate transporter receptor subunit TctC
VTTARRSPAAPQAPTLAEQGHATESWNALFAPNGTPPSIIARLAGLAADMANDQDIQRRMANFGSTVVANDPQAFRQMLREEAAQWSNLVKDIGLK